MAKRGQIVQFFREVCPRKKCSPKSGRNITAIARKLLTVLYLDYEDLSYCYCLVGLVSFNALAIEWLIVYIALAVLG
jgi:hypothetical protein